MTKILKKLERCAGMKVTVVRVSDPHECKLHRGGWTSWPGRSNKLQREFIMRNYSSLKNIKKLPWPGK